MRYHLLTINRDTMIVGSKITLYTLHNLMFTGRGVSSRRAGDEIAPNINKCEVFLPSFRGYMVNEDHELFNLMFLTFADDGGKYNIKVNDIQKKLGEVFLKYINSLAT